MANKKGSINRRCLDGSQEFCRDQGQGYTTNSAFSGGPQEEAERILAMLCGKILTFL
jgi:hypothetical protein